MARNLLRCWCASCASFRDSDMRLPNFLLHRNRDDGARLRSDRSRHTEPDRGRRVQRPAPRLGSGCRRQLYKLEYKAHQTSAFVQMGSNYPASVTVARFGCHCISSTGPTRAIASPACNSSGCTRSPEVSVSGLRRYAVGYFKADQSVIGLGFGADTDISPDGLNFVSAALESMRGEVSMCSGAAPMGPGSSERSSCPPRAVHRGQQYHERRHQRRRQYRRVRHAAVFSPGIRRGQW
jgi:hypothetical protein